MDFSRKLELSKDASTTKSQSPIGSGPDMDLISCWNVFEMRLRSQSPIGSGPDMDDDIVRVKDIVVLKSQSPIGSGPDMDSQSRQ